jgi:hypothetical protein
MSVIKTWLREPRAINAAQIVQYTIAVFAGAMAVMGVASPLFLTRTVNGPVIASVGCILVVGGALGVFAVAKGLWWVERIALWIVGIGLLMLLVPAVYFAVNGHSPAIWIVLYLVVWALCDVFKRYRRIDWAYLDPAK